MLLVGLLLFLGECVGHVALLVFGLNWLYGTALPEGFLKRMRLANWFLAAIGPLGFWLAFGFDLPDAWLQSSDTSLPLASGYALLCSVLGLVILPAITLQRCLRRPPPALLSNHTQTVD